MLHATTVKKLEGKPDGTYVYSDHDGKERVGWMPPDMLHHILQTPGVRKVTPVRIRQVDDRVAEAFWPLDEATEKKFADADGVVHVLAQGAGVEVKYYFVAKVLWERYDAVAVIVMNPRLSEEEKQARMKALLKK